MILTIFRENYLTSVSKRGLENEAQKSNFWKFGSVYRFCCPVFRTLILYFVAELWKISEMDSPSPGLCYNSPCFSWIWIFNLMPKYTLYCLLILTSFAELDQSFQGLLSFERLDRASPDLWPEQSELILFQDENWKLKCEKKTLYFLVIFKNNLCISMKIPFGLGGDKWRKGEHRTDGM